MKTRNIKKIIFICNHANFFLSHRSNLLNFCVDNKIEHKLLIGRSASKLLEKDAIEYLKINKTNFKQLNFHTSKFKILDDLLSILIIFIEIIKFRPSIVHSISNKPIIFSIILSFFIKTKFLFSFSGFGYLYTNKDNSFKKKIFETIINIFKNKRCYFIVQNTRDLEYLYSFFNLKKKNLYLIKGSGVDLNQYNNNLNFINNKIILFPARPLISKGIIEFCEAALLIKNKYKNWKFVVVGDFEYESPDIISLNQINKYQINNTVEFWGYKKNMIKIYSQSKIVCLPSYREGFPKVLIEAAAMGLPTITSDDPGCIEAILANKTGYIVPSKNITILSEKIVSIMTDDKTYLRFSKNSINFAKENFDIKKITQIHQMIYQSILY